MKKTVFCLLLAAAGAAHAEISFVKPMTETECRQVLRDATDMYYDSHYCETESNEQTQQHATIAWYALGELNSRSSNEEFNRCPDLRLRGAEKDAFLAPYPKSHDAAETARFCTPGNRARIAPLYPRYLPLLKELERVRRQR